MLKNINPLLNADVLYCLAAMGHGDTVVICDANFPADAIARATVYGSLLHIDVDAPTAVRAVLSLMPLDTFVEDSVRRMEVVDNPEEVPLVQREIQAEINKAEGKPWPATAIDRMDFYEYARDAYCLIQTSERRFYGCFILRKGVIAP